jgi:hypothetical protein
MPVMLAPPGSSFDQRVDAIEKALRQVSVVADGALQIPPQMRGGTPGQAIAGGQPLLDPQGLIAVMAVAGSVYHLGGQTLAGVGTPFEVTIASVTFTLTRPANIWLVSTIGGLANYTPGVFSIVAPVYFKIDGVQSTQTIGYLPRYGAVAVGQYQSTVTLSEVDNLTRGAHTITLTWLSAGVNDTLNDFSDSLIAMRIGA